MAETVFEQLVETYLARNADYFCHPQYFVGEQNGWKWVCGRRIPTFYKSKSVSTKVWFLPPLPPL